MLSDGLVSLEDPSNQFDDAIAILSGDSVSHSDHNDLDKPTQHILAILYPLILCTTL